MKEETIKRLNNVVEWNQWRGENRLLHIDLCQTDLSRADLYGADLQEADLREADLRGANLREANLQEADLRGADLEKANLYKAHLDGADLEKANLYKADLRGTKLQEANLQEANLRGTCLDRVFLKFLKDFVQNTPHLNGQRVVYRTKFSQHIGGTCYQVGEIYTAPNLSFSVETACHPGIYAGSLELLYHEFPKKPLVRCSVKDWHWVICAKGYIRCAELTVLADVTDIENERRYLKTL